MATDRPRSFPSSCMYMYASTSTSFQAKRRRDERTQEFKTTGEGAPQGEEMAFLVCAFPDLSRPGRAGRGWEIGGGDRGGDRGWAGLKNPRGRNMALMEKWWDNEKVVAGGGPTHGRNVTGVAAF